MNGIGDTQQQVIRTTVWSGFLGPNDIEGLIEDLRLEAPELEEAALWAAVNAEMAEKAKAERGWPATTDCDRLDAAFEALPGARVLALHNAGFTLADGHADAAAALAQEPPGTYVGYCFYHAQDIARALAAEPLLIAFDHVAGAVPDKIAVGARVVAELKASGLTPVWPGDPARRIALEGFTWRRRFVEGEALWG
ncbi:DUF6891 domain-containing protein [Azorhizobium doebereinerae]|uniref:DUF6891 domain-containing protein n=1 Tax=Azorhizobium doebereinerae TaxID=281091 RepID=UPI0004278FFC|nr:hypothetical protein [Azorhizobium doebereinerae]